MYELRLLIYKLVISKTINVASLVKSKDGSAVRYVSTVRYASILAKKYGTLVRYAFFLMVRVRYVGTVRFKNWTEVRYGSRYVVRKFWTYRTVLPSLMLSQKLINWAFLLTWIWIVAACVFIDRKGRNLAMHSCFLDYRATGNINAKKVSIFIATLVGLNKSKINFILQE